MKRIFLYLSFVSVLITTSCRKDDSVAQTPEVALDTQNLNDDQAIQNFLETHYLDAKGNVKDYVTTDTVNVKLSLLNPITLPSGVVYIARNNAQPNPGKSIASNDIISLMTSSTSYVSSNTDGKVSFTSPANFSNTVVGSGSPDQDPAYYYVKNSVLKAYNTKNSTSYDHSFYEIQGFREALQKFNAFDIPNDTNYNMQGVIIVPSRAAFARDPHYNYTGFSLRNRSFIFSFQVYKTQTRVIPDQD